MTNEVCASTTSVDTDFQMTGGAPERMDPKRILFYPPFIMFVGELVREGTNRLDMEGK